MRVTQQERFEKRVRVMVSRVFRTCTKCHTKVKKEPMYRIRVWGPGQGGHPQFLCSTCAPTKKHALGYWGHQKEYS